jgi:thiol-disulfide isomerase/thioredoxin
MYKKILLFGFLIISFTITKSQTALQKGLWRASLLRTDGKDIVFNLDVQQQKGKTVFYVVNGQERMLINDYTIEQDSLFINMPVFESSFRLKMLSGDSLAGVWIKRGVSKNLVMPFSASLKQKDRFNAVNGHAKNVVSGKWAIDMISGTEHEPAIGNFSQKGDQVTGSILTPSGDYRFLSGIVTGDSLMLSTFDGVHAMLFTARIKGDSLINAKRYSSASPAGIWAGIKNEKVVLPDEKLTKVKDGQDGQLDFTFKDLDGKLVSIKDERFKNKVVIIQIMGSWCPNCMDETAFMSEYYKKNKDKGVEMIGLCYEYTTDLNRSIASVRKFQKRFDVKYPLLITPVALSDPERTQKTLPQLTDIKVFPTTIILDKSGKVSEITSDFFGPGTGVYYTLYKEKFEKTISGLLKK